MGDNDLQHRGRGRQGDYAFGTAEHGWTGFDVVRFHAVEEMSRPFEVDITLVREASEAPAAEPDFSSFKAPRGLYRFQVTDSARIKSPTIRPYVVQYNESDLDFVSRLLEEEGISYLFEQGDDACLLTITDRPGKSPLF